MSLLAYNPVTAHCFNWKKIYSEYRRHLDFEKPELTCVECSKPGSKRCGGCREVAYCCQDHQKAHWKKEHNKKCCPFKIATDPENPERGRFVIATRDLLPGDVIIEEPPITVGPKQYTSPLCLGCYKPVDGSYICQGCSWPMCSELCCQAPIHKLTGECAILAHSSFKPKIKPNCPTNELPIYESLTPMRCILSKKFSSQNWQVMKLMEQHTEQRKKDQFYLVNHTNTVKYLLDHVLPSADEKVNQNHNTNEIQSQSVLLNDLITEEEIHAAIDVLDVNAFEIRGPDFSIRGVYPLTAMMNSVCNPNTQNCIDSDLTCRVRAAVPIKKGEEITSTYTLTLSGTFYRRHQLKESKYFYCNCQRCSSPTELGSHFSSLVCQTCHDQNKGFIIPKDSLDQDSVWECQNCHSQMTSKEVTDLIDTLEAVVASAEATLEGHESLLNKLSSLLHPNHNLIIDLEYSLALMYSKNLSGVSQQEKLRQATRKKELCQHLLTVFNMVTPGHFRSRGIFLFELYRATAFLVKNSFEKNELSKEVLIQKLSEAGSNLDESIQILSYELSGSNEFQCCTSARECQKQLATFIKSLQSS